jgi:hypothetical protein
MNAQPQNETPTPAELLAGEDLAGAGFTAGVDRGYWREAELSWPYAVIEIAAAPRPYGPPWWAFRFDLTGYPQAPTARPWDIPNRMPLDPAHWPTGGTRIQAAFNPGWRTDALYLPVDRLALEGHDMWHTKHSCYVWDPARDITQYLRLLHQLLCEDSYTGARG